MALVVVDVCRRFKRRQLVCWLRPNSYERDVQRWAIQRIVTWIYLTILWEAVGSNFMQLKAVNVLKCSTKVEDSRRVSNLIDNL